MKIPYSIKTRIRNLINGMGFEITPLRRLPSITESRLYRHFLGGGFDPRVILDIGANKGTTAISFHQEFPDASIHAFEPIKATFEMLIRQVEGVASITARNIALSDRDGEMEILTYAEPGSEKNSLSEARLRVIAAEGGVSETVRLQRGRTYLDSLGMDRVDILKTDTEGHDIAVLEGFGEYLETGGIKTVVCEVGFGADTMHTSFDALHDLMKSRGYVLCGIYECHYEPPAAHGFANALYVHGSESLECS